MMRVEAGAVPRAPVGNWSASGPGRGVGRHGQALQPAPEPEFEEAGLRPVDFGEFLVERRVLDEEQLLDVLADHWARRAPLHDSIAARGYVPPARLAALLAEFENVHVVYV
jgi:hypothetical protein